VPSLPLVYAPLLGQLILRKVPSFKIEMGIFLKINFSIGPGCAGGRGASREIGVVSGSRQYRVEHGLSELASERVLLARVVAPDQQQLAKTLLHPMTKSGPRPGDRESSAAERLECDRPSERAKRHHAPQLRQYQRQFAIKPRCTGLPFQRGGRIGRRSTTHRGRHSRPDEALAIAGVHARWLHRKASPVQSREQPVATAVAGEDSPSPIAAVRRRRKPQHQQSRVVVSPAGQRPAPVRLVSKGAAS
jgi:hypothetical protein